MVAGKADNFQLDLASASARGDTKRVKALIKKGASLNRTDTRGYAYTPLHQACKNGKLGVAQILIEKGADINVRESNGKTPLYLACEKGHTQLVSLLIDYQADLNIADKFKILPLLVSFFNQRTLTTELLKNKGAKFFAPDDKEETWSYLANQHRDAELAKRVIEAVLSQNPEEKKPNVIQDHKVLSSYWDEIISLKKIIFPGITLFCIAHLKDENKLMTLSRNEKIKKTINQSDFIEKHPYHGNSIKENLKKGLDRSDLIEALVKNEILHKEVFSSESKKVSLDENSKKAVLAYLTHLDLTLLDKVKPARK